MGFFIVSFKKINAEKNNKALGTNKSRFKSLGNEKNRLEFVF